MIQDREAKKKLGRKIEGWAACLLPYEENGDIASDAFRAAIKRTNDAGLGCAVNMDTGYANYLSDDEREKVLEWTRATLPQGRDFVAGVFVEGLEGDLEKLYRQGMDTVVAHGGTPILFQTTRFHDWKAREISDFYAKICEPYQKVVGFELGKMFASNGMIFEEETVRGLLEIPSLIGMKHSSLSRELELERLVLRDELRPDFKIFTGNDLGIDMTEYGSDYLLGLAAFCPEKFAERDEYWEKGDERYYELTDALQYLGNVGFRAPVPAYKHSCAHFQHALGRIPSSEPHEKCQRRPDWEAEMIADCVKRLGYSI